MPFRFGPEAYLTTAPKSNRPIPEQLLGLMELASDQIRSKTKMTDLDKILKERKSDLARQQEKTPDFPSSWQAIQRCVTAGQRDFNKSQKEYQQHDERLHSALGQLSSLFHDYISAILHDHLSGQKTSPPSPTAPRGAPTGPKAGQKLAEIKSTEFRLAELENQQRSMAAKNANELQAMQKTVQMLMAEREELRAKSQHNAENERKAEILADDHAKLVTEHQRLSDRCAKLETESQKQSAECNRLQGLLHENVMVCTNLEKKVDRPREEDRKICQDLEKTRAELEGVKQRLSDSEEKNRQQMPDSELRGGLQTLREGQDKLGSRLSSVEKRATTVESSCDEVAQGLEGLKASVKSESRNVSPTSEHISSEFMDKVRHAITEAGFTSSLESMNEIVQSHERLLTGFDPNELDERWWSLLTVIKKVDVVSGKVSVLENLQNELRTEVREARRSASAGTSGDGIVSAASQTAAVSSAMDNAGGPATSAAIRKANEAVEYTKALKKMINTMVVTVGEKVHVMESQVQSIKKDTGAELATINERLDALKQNGISENNNSANGAEQAQAAGVAEKVSTIIKDLANIKDNLRALTGEHKTLDDSTREGLEDLSGRLDSVKQLVTGFVRQRQTMNAPASSDVLLPNLRPGSQAAAFQRQASDPQDVKRPRGGGSTGPARKRPRTEQSHSQTPPTSNGNGNGNGRQ